MTSMIDWIAAGYRLLALGLPGDLRRACLPDMLSDLEGVLLREKAVRGRWGVLSAGIRALGDLTWTVLRERWVALRGYEWQRTARRRAGFDMGERMMMWTRELRLALRALMRRPGFTAIAALTLGLGIGATVAIFGVVNAVVLQPLPFPDSDRIVELRHHAPGVDLPDLTNSPGTLEFYRERARSWDLLVAIGGGGANLQVTDRTNRVRVFVAEPGIFDMLSLRPTIGRAFTEADVVDDPAQNVALIAPGLWRREFGADPNVVGRTVTLDNRTIEIIGVLPDDFRMPNFGDVDMMAPLWVDPDGGWGTFGTTVYGRLGPGVTFEAASQEITALQAQVPEYDPEITLERLEAFGWQASIRTMKDAVVGDTGSQLLIVFGTVGLVLLIACANVANLFLVRAESRQKELAIRAAMGAGRAQVAGGFLSEAIVLGALGGLVGIGIASGGLTWLTSLDIDMPRLNEVSITPTVLGFTVVVSVVSALLLGAIPMVRYAGRGFASMLRDGNRTSTDGSGRHRARNLLVMSQLALGLVLLVGSGLLYRSLGAMQRIDLGFDPTNTLAVEMSVGQNVEPLEAASFYQEITDRVAALPGVEAAGFGSGGPLLSGNFSGGSFEVDGEDRPEDVLPEVALYRAMGPGYFEALGLRLVEGRTMTAADWRGGNPVVWVNEYVRDQFLEGEAIGKRIGWGTGGDEDEGQDRDQYAEIVGVFAQTKEQSPTEDPGGFALLPMLVGDWGYPQIPSGHVFARGAPGFDVAQLAPQIRAIVQELNSSVPITEVSMMEEAVAESMADRSITMTLLSIAALVALFLGTIGLFGVISYVVGQRTREIGIRIALGADTGTVSRLVVRQGVGVIVGGIALGLIGA
ncbi:MAG: ABC transporter permease, partial [Gemmatimonadetes bacterium]|nr:ABC transporter permease [Gemmatimonadota bacterium]